MKIKASLFFTLAAACLGVSIACVEMGVRAIVAEEADGAWEKVTAPEPAAKAE